MFTVVLCVSLFILSVFFYLVRFSNAHKLPPAYPGALPIIGHTHLLFREPSKIWLLLQDTAKYSFEHGGVIYGKFGLQIYYLITDPQDALTASNICLNKHFAFEFAKSWLGDGLVTSSGDIWKRHRQLLATAFSIPVVLGFLEIFNRQARKLIKQVELHSGKGSFDHHTYLRNIMLETVCLGTFGIEPIENTDFTKKYMESADVAMRLVTHRFQTVWLHNDLLYKLSGYKKMEYETSKTFQRMSDEILQRKKAAMKSNVNRNKDVKTKGIKFMPFMDLVLELSADGVLTDKEIRDEVDTMIGAGFETTSNQLTYILMMLGAHPDVQDNMLKESLEVLGPDRDIDKEDLSKLVYTNAVIMECLRMLPSIPFILRRVDKDVSLKNYTMRAGSQCIIYPLLHQQEPKWGPEGDKFNPERWLNNEALQGSKEFAAFGLGKRSCIGKQYATIIMKVFLAHFIRKYKITADVRKLKIQCDFVLKPVSGHGIAIEKRI